MSDRINQLKTRFQKYSDWEDRYRELIKIGKEMEPFDPQYQIEKFQVKGCQSKVWLRPEYRGGRVFFTADSDAVLVRGIVALIVLAYNNQTPDEILNTKPDFLKEIGITEHLSMNRTNGLASMLKQVQMYAIVYKSLADKGIQDADNI